MTYRSVLVHLSLIIAAAPRLHSFLARIPSGQASVQLRSFILPSRLMTTNQTGNGTASNIQNNGNSGKRDSIKDVLNDRMATNVDDIKEDKGSAASSSSAQSDGRHRAIMVECYIKGEQGRGPAKDLVKGNGIY
jgi:hypothetical protein